MPVIKFDGIVDKSSEDSSKQLFANNLLRIKDFKSWKCKEWDETAFVVLEVKEPQKVESIEIGNDSSAFVEVLVANSSDPKPRFQVLLSISSFMTPSDSKGLNNCKRIREFTKDKLSPNARNERWDRFKIVCKQPFNREISYGLSFVRFNSKEESDDSMETLPIKTNFGPFRLRSDDNDDKDSDINSGSLFARRNNHLNESNAQKRTLAAAVGLTPSSSKTQTIKQNTSVNSKPKISQISPPKPQKIGESSVSSSVTKSEASPPKRVRKVVQQKPFNQIMSGVVFALSGFVNPKRGDIRDKAIKMGAKYRPDWDQSCTHLICAFVNTPKFNEVKTKKGRIVSEKWIFDSYNQKKPISWKKYALEQTSDEEEEDMDDDEEYKPQVMNNKKKIQYFEDDDEEDEDKSQIKEVIGFGSNNNSNENNNDLNDEIYDMETDESTSPDIIDPIPSSSAANQSSTQEIDIFKGKYFCLFGSFEEKEKQLLTDYIISHNGKLEETISENVKYVVTNSDWNEDFEGACLSNESLVFVKPKWIEKCHQNSKLIPFQPFIVSFNYE